MKRWYSFVFGMVLAVFLLPVSFFVTVLLTPAWRWLEMSYGIESVGHSGPSEWCFWFIYALLLVPSLFLSWRVRKDD